MGVVVLRRAAGGEHALSLGERVLYHQIHPVKVYSDIATALVGIDLFWHQQLGPALVIAVAVPTMISAALIGEADLERLRRGAMGAYLRRFMPPWLHAVRAFGIALAFYAAWHHFPAGIIAGIALSAACWANGIGRGRPQY